MSDYIIEMNHITKRFQIHRGKKAQSLLHRLHAHDDILGDRVVAYQFKVLVYHTDIQFWWI